MSEQHDCRGQTEITCPYCGYKDINSWECGMYDGDEEEDECKHCGETFTVSCEVSRTFTSAKKKVAT